jgi:hypothetical protein
MVKCMGGFITERDFATAECEFPGIQDFYEHLDRKPATFLQLVWAFEHPEERSGTTGATVSHPVDA